MNQLTPILVATITTFGAVLVAMLERTRRQNNRDHAHNSAKLDQVLDVVHDTRARLTDHLTWHAHRKDSPE